MAFTMPLDIQYWLVNLFAGNINIFFIFSFVLIVFLSAMFRMPTLISVVFMGLFAFMFRQWGAELYLILFITILGFLAVPIIKRMID